MIFKKSFLFLFLLAQFFVFSPVIMNSNSSTARASSAGITSASDDFTNKNDMARVLCNVMNFVTGGVGKTFAAFAIISLGVGFFAGKISWGTMIGVVLGIAAMFGAPTIIGAITGGTFDCNW